MNPDDEFFQNPGESPVNETDSSGPEDPPAPEETAPRPRVVKAVRMVDIARAARVSQGAVSALLNDRDYGIRVGPKARDRVFKVCREMGYVPGDLRATVRLYPELGETCLLVSTRIPGGLTNPYVARIASAMMAKAPLKRSCISVALYDEEKDYGPQDELPWPIKNGITSRLIFLGPVSRSIFAIAEYRGNPTLLIGHVAHSQRATSVVPDYLGAARSALGLFVRNGHRRVDIVGGTFGSAEPRISEMHRAIEIASQETGLPIRTQNIHHGELGVEFGLQALSSMLGREFPPTAIFCLDESTANGVLAGARARGISVPRQLSVIAVTDQELEQSSRLPLTSVVLPVEEMATIALDEADRQIAAGIPTDPRTLVAAARLMERMTCGPSSS